ncbi:MAG: energy-coupling factor ABC transporter ATP-binding protein [Treponema sp.]|jgi:cobalt/nickel transport system ATP-binding protein|nr:energy-coupling factor ABC transporter ATP-binding protein [Treponema sp.]
MEHLRVEGLSYRYDDGTEALRNVSFSAGKGTCVCIAGSNGSGKSTLLEIIASCMKPSGGSVSIDGVPAGRSSASKTGIVFQEPDNQFFMPTVWEDVAFAVMKKGVSAETARELALRALGLVDAEYLAHRPPYKLSGGEKQRAAIASILIMENEILLLDEPTAALDPRSRKNLIALIGNLRCTRIIASHDLNMMLDIADSVVFLNNGEVSAQSPVPGLLLDENYLKGIGLELPIGVKGS